jgi:hypothetical protein
VRLRECARFVIPAFCSVIPGLTGNLHFIELEGEALSSRALQKIVCENRGYRLILRTKGVWILVLVRSAQKGDYYSLQTVYQQVSVLAVK